MSDKPLDMSEIILFSGWAVLFVMAIVWLGAVAWLFRRLRNYHQPAYESLGSPTLFWNNLPRNQWLFAKFLFSSQWKSLDDPMLIRVCWIMRILLCACTVGVLLVMAAFIWYIPDRSRSSTNRHPESVSIAKNQTRGVSQ